MTSMESNSDPVVIDVDVDADVDGEQEEVQLQEVEPGKGATKKSLRWAADVVDNSHRSTALKPKKKSDAKPAKPRLCSFCGKHPACVRLKASWRGKDKKQSLCLLHYYTTLAVHADSHHVVVLDRDLLQVQWKGDTTTTNNNNIKSSKLQVQDLFAEAYTQLQSELAQESLSVPVGESKSTTSTPKQPPKRKPNKDDPLAILHDLSRSHKKRKVVPPPPSSSLRQETAGGGFLKPLPIPERLRKTQEQQAKWQAEQIARMNRVAKTGQPQTFQRRQPTRKSIWNSVLDTPNAQPTNGQDRKIHWKDNDNIDDNDVTCSSCGSTKVEAMGNITSRNADVRKGEVWGSGGRDDDVIQRYRCNQCGKSWQETA